MGDQLNKLFPAAAAAAILVLTGCGGGARESAEPTATASPTSAGKVGIMSTDQSCNQLLDKGDKGRLLTAQTFVANLPAEVTPTHRITAKISAGDLEYVAKTANDTMKPLILDLANPLKELGEGAGQDFDREGYTAAESKVLEKCKHQYASYQGNKAAQEKAAADAAAKRAAEEAAEAAKNAPKDYAGAGDDIVTITKHSTGAQVAVITHNGGSNFAVHTLDAALENTNLLVNTIGNYSGTVLFDARSRGETTALKITADGPWTVKLVSLSSVRSFDGSAPMTGTGDDVFHYKGASKPAVFTHDGSSNIAVHRFGTRPDLLINEIGAYTGTVVWATGLYQVTADGNWSATLK